MNEELVNAENINNDLPASPPAKKFRPLSNQEKKDKAAEAELHQSIQEVLDDDSLQVRKTLQSLKDTIFLLDEINCVIYVGGSFAPPTEAHTQMIQQLAVAYHNCIILVCPASNLYRKESITNGNNYTIPQKYKVKGKTVIKNTDLRLALVKEMVAEAKRRTGAMNIYIYHYTNRG